MKRCLELASNASGFTAPNPMVGAVLVHEGKIVGEGFHHAYGEPHAEVNAVNDAIRRGNNNLLNQCELYVNLEPCSHIGKTPPCTDLIIRYGIPKVIIGSLDPNPSVNGTGIRKLKEAGVEVITGVMESECIDFNRRFITYHTRKRPYVLIKFAQTADQFIAPEVGFDKKISNEYSDMIVHKWRSEEAAILVGTRTAEVDNPSLNVRNWKGKNPVRAVVDRQLRLPSGMNLFDEASPTLVFNELRNGMTNNIEYIKIDFGALPQNILAELFNRNLLSVMIEGGNRLLTQFIENGLWDEARIITATGKIFGKGIVAPPIEGRLVAESMFDGDLLQEIRH